MTKMNPKNVNKTKPEVFSWDILKSDVIYFFAKKYLSISVTFKIKLSQFYD